MIGLTFSAFAPCPPQSFERRSAEMIRDVGDNVPPGNGRATRRIAVLSPIRPAPPLADSFAGFLGVAGAA